jgi:hypothetical protein
MEEEEEKTSKAEKEKSSFEVALGIADSERGRKSSHTCKNLLNFENLAKMPKKRNRRGFW